MDIYQSDSVLQILSRVFKLHRRHLHELLQEYEVYPGQPPLLIRLSEKDGQSQHELAAQMRVKPATLTVMITRMEKTGLLRRGTDSRDQRVSRVYLTDKGHRATTAVKQALREIEETCLKGFLTEEKLLFRRLLLQMYENLKDIEEQID
ncbi:MarR family winged helix-turn-helix transcriptional regulator [Paenibacillus sp. 1P03SA]|uniref:MarR family winged helix-turn-helix transcriptional regulator n=1 Tax=Paenibacillus sp. 1P03SA TaxID=3132294 RepID=UPI0039A11FA1